METAKEQIIKIQNTRYKLSCIKKYEPFETVNTAIKNDSQKTVEKTPGNRYGIYVYFSASNSKFKDYFYYDKAEDRDVMLQKLDEKFGLSY